MSARLPPTLGTAAASCCCKGFQAHYPRNDRKGVPGARDVGPSVPWLPARLSRGYIVFPATYEMVLWKNRLHIRPARSHHDHARRCPRRCPRRPHPTMAAAPRHCSEVLCGADEGGQRRCDGRLNNGDEARFEVFEPRWPSQERRRPTRRRRRGRQERGRAGRRLLTEGVGLRVRGRAARRSDAWMSGTPLFSALPLFYVE